MNVISYVVGNTLRAVNRALQVPSTVSGSLTSVSVPGLLSPVTYTRGGGSDANLTLSGSDISAAAALGDGVQQTISGTASAADGVVVPWSYTFTGVVAVPLAPTVTVAAGNALIFVGWTDTGVVTHHKVYLDGVLVATVPVAQTSITLTGLTNGVSYSVQVSAVNSTGEGVKSAAQTATPILMGIDQTALPSATYDVGYTQQRSIFGGTAPYTAAVTSGTLPTGLEVCCSGQYLVVSGIPAVAFAAANVTITVTDAAGATMDYTSSISVPPFPSALTVEFGEKTRAQHGGHYLGNAAGGALTITAGNAAGHWVIVDNRLVPAGTYAGTPPTFTGPYTLTVNNDTSDCVVTINIVPNVAHTAVGTATNADTSSTHQLRTLLAGTVIARGDVVKMRNGSYNPTQLDFRLRPAASYTGTGRITITSEWPDPFVDSQGNPRRGGGAQWSQLKVDSAVSGDVEMPFDFKNVTFYSNAAAGLTAGTFLLGYATNGWGVGSQYCRYSQGPAVPNAYLAYGFQLRGSASATYDCSYNTFQNLKRMVTVGSSAASGVATGCTVTYNDGFDIWEDGIAFLASQVSGVVCTDNLMPSWRYTVGAHQDGIQDQGSSIGAIPFGEVSRNIIYNVDPAVGVQGLFNDDSVSGSSRDNAIFRNNIIISNAPNGLVMTRFNNPTVERNTIIASLVSSAYDLNIRTSTSSPGTGGTFGGNVSNVMDISSQTGTTSTNNITLTRSLVSYQAAFAYWSEAGSLLTRQAIKRLVTPANGGPLMNGDGTYSGALMPDGSWNVGLVP